MEHYYGRQLSYYSVLGVGEDATINEIRSAYRKQAMKWHPDRRRCGDQRAIEKANRRFQIIQEAYQVLSDDKKRRLYDCGLYDPMQDDEEEVEGLHDFVEEMTSLMDAVNREGKEYSLSDLQQMLVDMTNSYHWSQGAAFF